MFLEYVHIPDVPLVRLGDAFGFGGLMGGEFLVRLLFGQFLCILPGGFGHFQLMLGLFELEGAFAVILAGEILFVAGDGAEHGGDLADAVLGGSFIAHELEDEDFVEVHEGGEVGRVVGFEPLIDGFGPGAGSGEPFDREVVRGGSGSGLGGGIV